MHFVCGGSAQPAAIPGLPHAAFPFVPDAIYGPHVAFFA